jgi:hypothetical protein
MFGSFAPWGKALRAFVLLAFLARALVPPGFMFEAQAGTAQVKVVLCSVHGSIEAYVDPATGEISYTKKPPKPSDKDDPPCAFATIAKVAAPSNIDVAPTPREHKSHNTHTHRDLAPGCGLSAPPPPATGPPSHLI